MQATAFGQVCDDWVLRDLPDVLFFQEGPGLRRWQWTHAGMKVINGKNILLSGSIDTSNTERFISLDEFRERYQRFAIDAGDIVVTSSGTIGKVARITAEHVPMMMNTSVIRFRSLDTSVLTDEFAYAFLRSPLFAAQADVAATGAAQRNFGPAHLKQMQVPIPPRRVQEKIAAVLEAYDELIENNLRRIEILEEMAQAVYREWFVNFRYPDHESVPLVDSPLGLIPEGWDTSQFGMVAEHVRVSINPAKAPNEEFDHYSFAAFDGSQTASVELGSTMKSGKLLVDQPSVLLAKLNPRIPRVWFARPTGDRRSITSSEFLVLRSRPGIPLEYLYAISSDPGFQAKISKMSGGTSTSHQRLKVEDLMAQPHVVPEERVLRLFEDQARPMYELREILIRMNVNLRETRDLLLPKLVSGEIDVSDLDIDTEWLAS